MEKTETKIVVKPEYLSKLWSFEYKKHIKDYKVLDVVGITYSDNGKKVYTTHIEHEGFVYVLNLKEKYVYTLKQLRNEKMKKIIKNR